MRMVGEGNEKELLIPLLIRELQSLWFFHFTLGMNIISSSDQSEVHPPIYKIFIGNLLCVHK